jgi:hypothetical protein
VLKVTYHANWHVMVDGAEVAAFIVSPSSVGVSLPASQHFVSAQYVSTPVKAPLLVLSLVTVLALALVTQWERLRRVRLASARRRGLVQVRELLRPENLTPQTPDPLSCGGTRDPQVRLPRPRGLRRRAFRDGWVSSGECGRDRTYLAMKLLIRATCVAGLAFIALVLAWRGGAAAASSEPACGPASGFVPQFCITVPSGSTTRNETTIALASVATATADLRVEAGIPANEVLRIASALDRASAQVERVFGRGFGERPRVLLFATPASFAKGVEDLFGYAPQTAQTAAASYAGIVDQGTLTVAVDFGAVGGDDLAGLLAHELVHVMIRETAGQTATLPAWFEEGFATVIQREDSLPGDTDTLVARSLVASGTVRLDALVTLADWHRSFARVGRPQYALAAAAVRAMADKVGEQGLVRALAAVGAGTSFADAYAALGAGSLADFTTAFAASAAGAGIAVGSTESAAGDLAWTLYSFGPNATVSVHIAGERGYEVTYTVTTDDLGMFRGSFGSTAPAGSYAIEAKSGALEASAELVTR